MEQLGTYELVSTLTNENAGNSMWGFGKKNGKEFFIKQFVTVKYPIDNKIFSPETMQKKIKECEQFEKKRTAVYQSLNENSDGNAVRVEEFFRVEARYFISMQKIEALHLNMEAVAGLPEKEIRRLCAIIAHGIASLHKGHIVHADLKHDNILLMKTKTGHITAKIIDFEGSFLESDPPRAGDEIVGDLIYFSPEACISIWGEEIKLTCKMDIFALGVLFHQYFTGELPAFDSAQGEINYPGEAVAKGERLTVSNKLPRDIYNLLTRMLSPDPEKRPTAIEVFNELRGQTVTPPSGNPFHRPGDL